MNDISNKSYTDKDFQTIFPELLEYVNNLTLKWNPVESNESDPGVVLLKCMALVADKLNYNIDKNVLECFPVSVTQPKNARNLFQQLGYHMHWLQSAHVDVSILWKGEFTDEVIQIPRFTQVADSELETVFTLTQNATLRATANKNYVTVDAIEGAVNQLSVSGETTINTSMLDSRRRIFLPTSNVAENGIFINNYGLENFSEWVAVDNLYVQAPDTKCYFVGVDAVSNLVYIQFSDYIINLIGDGLEIHYVVSNGANGNIKAYTLEQFFESTINGVDVGTDNVKLTNYSAAVGGLDIETIDDAYKNYMRNVNICDCLVTWQDFQNYLRASNVVSNCVVSDRTNTPYAYNYICEDADGRQYTSYFDALEASDPEYALAYDLFGCFAPTTIDIRALTPIASDKNITKELFDKSFAPYYEATPIIIRQVLTTVLQPTENVKLYLDELRHIGVRYANISSAAEFYPYMYADFNLDITLITNRKLSNAELTEVRSNISTALWESLNATQVEYGVEPDYNAIYDVVIKSDSRIKTLIIAPIEYRLIAHSVDEFVHELGPTAVQDLELLPLQGVFATA